MHRPSARASIVAMVGAMGAFVVNDALVKYASQSMPGAQLIFVRGLMALALVLVAAWRMGTIRRIGEISRGWVAARAVIDAAATVLFLVALFHLPISSVTAINMTSPLLITILAAVFLGERVGLAPWLATIAGFGGVLLIVKPQAGSVDAYAALCFTGTVLLSIRDLITQRVHASIPSILITLSNVAAVTLLAGVLSAIEGWGPVGLRELALLALASVFLTSAYFLLVQSTRHGALALAAPFRYSALLFAAVIGFVVWGDVPDGLAVAGMVVLVVSGIYVLRANRRARTAAPEVD